jgi:hypothetical protein
MDEDAGEVEPSHRSISPEHLLEEIKSAGPASKQVSVRGRADSVNNLEKDAFERGNISIVLQENSPLVCEFLSMCFELREGFIA